jgi:hypothetical protein
MLSNKMLVLRSFVFSFVLAAFFMSSFATPVHRATALSPSAAGTVNAPVLSADGTSPQPPPLPLIMNAA